MIRVTNDYCIDIDAMGYTVEKDEHKMYFDKQANKEKPYITNLAYFGKLEYAVKYIAERVGKDMVLESGEVTLAEAIELYRKAFKQVTDAMEKKMPY